jgi:hypothetical protein
VLNPEPPSIVEDHKIRDIMPHVPISAWWRGDSIFAIVIILVGVTAGLGGMLLALLLHAIQHAAYGYDLGAVVNPESFLQGVTAASPMRRVTVLALCGAVAGIGWWALYRFGGVVHFWSFWGNKRARGSGRPLGVGSRSTGLLCGGGRSASPVQACWFCSGPRPSRDSQCGWLSPVINSRGLFPTRSASWLRM